jgi:hypothetical protein
MASKARGYAWIAAILPALGIETGSELCARDAAELRFDDIETAFDAKEPVVHSVESHPHFRHFARDFGDAAAA